MAGTTHVTMPEPAEGDLAAAMDDAVPVRRDRFWRRFASNRAATAGAVVLAILIVMALIAPWLTSWDPTLQDLSQAFQKPSATHWLGTDNLGRDVLARIMYGGRYTLLIGVIAVALATLIGVPIGLVSGYYGAGVDMVIQRGADILLSFNAFLLALILVAVLGVGMQSVTIAAGIGVMPQFVRIARAEALSIRETDYVAAAVNFGAGSARIIWRHVLPNALTPVIVYATLNIGTTILVAAGLGFLGLGVQPPTPSWGQMIADGQAYLTTAWWMSVFPGLAIAIVVIAFNFLGDQLRDALDPRMR